MHIDILTLFPEMFEGVLTASILGRAQKNGHLTLETWNIRDFADGPHHNADDAPFGGGAGMVMLPKPIYSATQAAIEKQRAAKVRKIYLSPRGKTLTMDLARELAGEEQLILLCGHYEGVDQRALDLCQYEEVSIGDYVLTGGELPAMVLIDVISRHIPGVLGSGESMEEESFEGGLLEYPHYTRPREFMGREVPEVLLDGHHAKIAAWRRAKAIETTRQNRPDLLQKADLTPEEKYALARLAAENGDEK